MTKTSNRICVDYFPTFRREGRTRSAWGRGGGGGVKKWPPLSCLLTHCFYSPVVWEETSEATQSRQTESFLLVDWLDFCLFFPPDRCNFESVAASAAKIWLPVRGLFLKMGHLWCDCSAGAAFTPNWTSCQKKKTTLLLRYSRCTPSCITLAVVDFLQPNTKNTLCAPCKIYNRILSVYWRGIRFGVNFASADMMNTDRVRGKPVWNPI